MTKDLVARAMGDFADRNPKSRSNYDHARRFLPGGHTRTVLTHNPFPLTFIGGQNAELIDADGHTYIDLLGDYTAGLLGHSEHRVIDAVTNALHTNMSVGGIHPAEAKLAELMCARFGLDRVRFTNSGTEANLMAITTALYVTKRKKVMVFNGGYHGGIISFANGATPLNAPYEFVIAPYNDVAATQKIISDHAKSLAAVIVEPMLGSGGCIAASSEFIKTVFASAKKVGAVIIADEVMTSRHGAGGLCKIFGVQPDITTFGKYIGGGFSFGAFGGRAEFLDCFDTSPESNRESVIGHAGTFNNNISTISAGCVVLGEIFTASKAVDHTQRGNEFRESIATVLSRFRLPLSVCGYGSMMSLHALNQAPTRPEEMAKRDNDLQARVFFGMLERGIYSAPRGMINLSLPLTDDQLAASLDALDDTLNTITTA